MSELKHNHFTNIKDRNLQTFNRVVYCGNLVATFGEAAAEEYMEPLSDEDKARMMFTLGTIQEYGLDEVRAMIRSTVEFEEDVDYQEPFERALFELEQEVVDEALNN